MLRSFNLLMMDALVGEGQRLGLSSAAVEYVLLGGLDEKDEGWISSLDRGSVKASQVIARRFGSLMEVCRTRSSTSAGITEEVPKVQRSAERRHGKIRIEPSCW